MAKLRTLAPRLGTLDTRVSSGGKRADLIYATPEYRAWRAEVIRRSGGQCQDKQHDPAQPPTGIRLFADHVKELRDGGAPFDPDNGLARCGSCHTRKTAAERSKRR